MNQNIKVLSKPVRAADYKAVMKEITQQACFREHNYRIKVPAGWVYNIRDLTRDLVVLTKGNPELENFQIHRIAQLTTGDLFAELSHSDNRSVKGMVRKAMERCKHTCQCCAIPGRRYRIGDIHGTWCTNCAAAPLLLDDIALLDQRLSETFGSPTFAVRRMPAGLRQGFRKWVAMNGQAMPELGALVGAWDAREWRTALRPMESALKEFQDSGLLRGDAQ